MRRVHVLAALLGVSLPVVALAGRKPRDTATASAAVLPGGPTEAEILNPWFQCNGGFSAEIKNTGKVTATYTPTIVITKNGKCTKWAKVGIVRTCEVYGPDQEVTKTPKAMSISAGATKVLKITVADVPEVKKAEIKVLEQGKNSPVTKMVTRPGGCIK